MYYMINRLSPDQIAMDHKDWVDNSKLPWMPNDAKFAVRLHLFTLLMEVKKMPLVKVLHNSSIVFFTDIISLLKELKYDCAAAIDAKELIPTFITVLELSSLCLKSLKDEAAPKLVFKTLIAFRNVFIL